MSIIVQYAIDDAKVYQGFSKISLKAIQTSLQKTITWTKKLRKGKQEWKNVYIIVGLPTRMLKTPMKTQFASKVILLKKTLEYQNEISIYYGQQ
jgi:RNase H-fold protein (predicted Holliday junction resolvase)